MRAEEKKFEVGLSTSFKVLEFQKDLTEEQSKEIKAIIDYTKSIVNLYRVAGIALEKNNVELNWKNIWKARKQIPAGVEIAKTEGCHFRLDRGSN